MLNIDKKLLFCFVLSLMIVFVLGIKYSDFKNARKADEVILIGDTADEGKQAEKTSDNDGIEIKPAQIKVYVCGEVKNPGVYELLEGSRIYEVIEIAGGVLETSELRCIDMARVLSDQETIFVPAQGDMAEGDNLAAFAGSTGFKRPGLVNINTASASEMAQELTGIGPVLAGRIVDYRETNGSFKQVEDLKNVSGIGDKRFNDIKDKVCVR